MNLGKQECVPKVWLGGEFNLVRHLSPAHSIVLNKCRRFELVGGVDGFELDVTKVEPRVTGAHGNEPVNGHGDIDTSARSSGGDANRQVVEQSVGGMKFVFAIGFALGVDVDCAEQCGNHR